MTEEIVPWKTGDNYLSDEVYDALEPLDGFPKSTRCGPRIYRYKKWWVCVSFSDFGDTLVGPWGELAEPIHDENSASSEMIATLTTDITAAMLAMVSPEGEPGGYGPLDVIGPRGSNVTIVSDDDDHWVEVTGFANDPYAVGYVLRADLRF